MDFRISDPFGYYGVIELRIYQGNAAEPLATISVSPDDENHRFVGLMPETKYKVVIGYYPEGEDEFEFKVMDTMRAWTKSVACDFSIEVIDEDSLGYFARINDSYPAYSAKVVLLDASGNEAFSEEINILEACTAEGLTGNVDRLDVNAEYYRMQLKIYDSSPTATTVPTVLKAAKVKNPDYSSGGSASPVIYPEAFFTDQPSSQSGSGGALPSQQAPGSVTGPGDLIN